MKNRDRARDSLAAMMSDFTEWDEGTWQCWTVAGRILPERCHVDIGLQKMAVGSVTGRAVIRWEIASSLISATIWTETSNLSFAQLSDLVRSSLFFSVDYVAFQNRAFYEIVLDTCTDMQSGQTYPIPVTEPLFEPDRDGYLFKRHDGDRIDNLSIPTGLATPNLQRAVHDLPPRYRRLV